MSVESLEKILKDLPFLSGLSPDQLQTLVGCASNRRFAAGEYLCREGEEAGSFYLLREGRVAIEMHIPQRGGLRIETLEEGDVLGWSWLFAPYHWHFDGVALTVVRALALDGVCLRKKSKEDHELGYQLLKRFSCLMEKRLLATRLQLLDVFGDAAKRPGREFR